MSGPVPDGSELTLGHRHLPRASALISGKFSVREA